MDLQVATALSLYAYLQAGKGASGILASLGTARNAGLQAAGLVGGGTGVPATSQAAAQGGATYGLFASAGEGNRALQDLLRTGTGLSDLLPTGPGFLDPTAGTQAAYAYAQALKEGQGQAFLEAALQGASPGDVVTSLLASSQLPEPPTEQEPLGTPDLAAPSAAPSTAPSQTAAGTTSPGTTPTGTAPEPTFRAAPQDANGDGLVSNQEWLTYGFQHPGLDPADANQDGFVTPVERQAYALGHPPADPADGNGDGFVSYLEAQAYARDHPASGMDGGIRTAMVDTFA